MSSLIDQTLAELRAELADVEEQLVGMNALHARRLMLKDGIDVLEKIKKQETESPANRPVWEVARDLLASAQKPMSAGELMMQLKGMGVKFKGDTPTESLRTTLLRKSDVFSRVEGKFLLKTEGTKK